MEGWTFDLGFGGAFWRQKAKMIKVDLQKETM